MSGIHAGQLVAVHLQDSSDEPAIGRVLEVEDRELRIQWMKGTYTSAWKPWTVWQGRKNVAWEDSVPRSSILLYDFELSTAGRLRKPTVGHLKEAYKQFHEHLM